MRPLAQQRPWNGLCLYAWGAERVARREKAGGCAAIRHALENTHCNGKRSRLLDTSMLRQVSIRALPAGYNCGTFLKSLWIYIRRHVESGWVETLQGPFRQSHDGWANGQRSQQLWPRRHSQQTMRARLGVRDSTSALFALGSLTPRLPRARSGRLATHHDGRRRRPSDGPADGRLGEHFIFTLHD